MIHDRERERERERRCKGGRKKPFCFHLWLKRDKKPIATLHDASLFLTNQTVQIERKGTVTNKQASDGCMSSMSELASF